MAIHQIKKHSDLEKRLKLLRRQIYGKQKWEVGGVKMDDEVRSKKSQIPPQYPTSHLSPPTSNTASFRTDITYLHQDLLKISLLASLALGTQIILFYLLKNNVLRINFF